MESTASLGECCFRSHQWPICEGIFFFGPGSPILLSLWALLEFWERGTGITSNSGHVMLGQLEDFGPANQASSYIWMGAEESSTPVRWRRARLFALLGDVSVENQLSIRAGITGSRSGISVLDDELWLMSELTGVESQGPERLPWHFKEPRRRERKLLLKAFPQIPASTCHSGESKLTKEEGTVHYYPFFLRCQIPFLVPKGNVLCQTQYGHHAAVHETFLNERLHKC